MIYADNAATTQLDSDAFEAMKPFLLEQYANASQPYSFSRTAKKALMQSRDIIASCINAEPEEIYFTSGGTESDNWAIKGTMLDNSDHRAMLTSQIEHHAVLHSAAAIERLGFPVAYLPVSKQGVVEPDMLCRYITDRTKLVSIMFANNEIGTIQPIQELAGIAHAHGSLFHTDAVQAVGHCEIDVQKLGIDMLSSSAHKFNGPKGIGFLYVRNGSPIKPYADGGAQEHHLRAGTENIASIVGMATALQKNCNALSKNTEFLMQLEKELLSVLRANKIDFVINGSELRIPGNLSLSFRNASGEMLLHRLDLKGICVSTGSACNSQNTQISHVLQAINLPTDYAVGTIRISLGKYNTVEEVRAIANSIVNILR